MRSSLSISNRIVSMLAYCVLHPTVLSFMFMCWHYLWIQKRVCIRQSLASWQSWAGLVHSNSHFLSKLSAYWLVTQNHHQVSPQRRHQSNCPISNWGFMYLTGREKPEKPKISESHKSSLKCLSIRKQEMTNCVLLPSSNLLIQEYHHSLLMLWNTKSAVMYSVFQTCPKTSAYGSKCLVVSVWGLQ